MLYTCYNTNCMEKVDKELKIIFDHLHISNCLQLFMCEQKVWKGIYFYINFKKILRSTSYFLSILNEHSFNGHQT